MVPDPQVGVLGRLAGAAHRRRVLVVVLWLVAVVAAVGLSQVASGDFKADYTARGSDSRAAQDLLAQRFRGRRGAGHRRRHAAGPVTDPAVRSTVDGLLGRIATVPHVAAAPSPYGQQGAISADGRTLNATVQLDAAEPGRDAGRGHPADHRPGPGAPTGPGSRSRSAARWSRPPPRATSAPRASASPPRRSSCCWSSARSSPPGCRSWSRWSARRSALAGRRRRRGHRRAGLVDLAGRDDGHRRRRGLRAAAGHPLPGVPRPRPVPARRHDGDRGHRRPGRAGGRCRRSW